MTAPDLIPDGWALANAIAIPLPSTNQSQLICPGRAYLYGFGLIESTGTAAATFDLVDGMTNNGQTIAPKSLNAGQSDIETCPYPGLYLQNGLWLQMISGSVRGSFWVANIYQVQGH